MTLKDITAKIAKLHAKAESCEDLGNQEEAAAFAAKVQELLTQYKLDLTEVAIAKLDTEDPMGRGYTKDWGERRVLWQETLGQAVAKAHFCRMLVITSSSMLVYVGRGTDREIAVWVFNYLVDEIRRLSQKAYDRYYWEMEKAGTPWEAKGYRNSYVDGFVIAVAERYRKERKEREKDAKTGKALIFHTTAIDRYMDEVVRTCRADSINGQWSNHGTGYSDGKAAGHNVHIHGSTIVSPGQKGPRQIGGGK